LIREAKKSGDGGTFFNVPFGGAQALADELRKVSAGVVVSQVLPLSYSAARSIAREFAEAVKAAGKDVQPNFSSNEAYVAAKVSVEGLQRAGVRATRDTLITGREGGGRPSVGGFSVTFPPADPVASNFAGLSMLAGDGRVRT